MTVEVRRMHELVAIEAEISETLIVADDEEDVRARCCRE